MGLLAYDSLDDAAAVQYLLGTKKYHGRLLLAQIHLLEAQDDHDKKDELIARLKELIAANPSAIDLCNWNIKLADAQKVKALVSDMKSSAATAIQIADKHINNPRLSQGKLSIDSENDDATLDVANFWACKAKAQMILGQDEKARESWMGAADSLTREIKDSKDRGRKLRLAGYLHRAGANGQADRVLEGLQKLYPNEYTFYYYRAWYLQDEKKLGEAEDLARKSFDHSYGENMIAAAILLTNILKQESKTKDASTIAAKTLKQIRIPSDTNSWAYKQLTKLKALL